MNKRDILLYEIDKYDEIEAKVKAEAESISRDPKLIDILFSKGVQNYKAEIINRVSDKMNTLIEEAITLGDKTAKRLS